jgi:hypothetical protein
MSHRDEWGWQECHDKLSAYLREIHVARLLAATSLKESRSCPGPTWIATGWHGDYGPIWARSAIRVWLGWLLWLVAIGFPVVAWVRMQ